MPSESLMSHTVSDQAVSAGGDAHAKDLGEMVTQWVKLAGFLMLTAAVLTVLVLSFLQDYWQRNNIYIEFDQPPPIFSDAGFDSEAAAQSLVQGIWYIRHDAKTNFSETHPALVQQDVRDADLQQMTIAGTGWSLQAIEEFLQDIIPSLQPSEVIGSLGYSGNEVTLDVSLNNEPLASFKHGTTAASAVDTARTLLFSGHIENDAAFAIVQRTDPYVAMSALNSWGKNPDAVKLLQDFIAGPQDPALLPYVYNLLAFIEIEQNDESDAIAHLQQAPNLALAHANLCYIYQDVSGPHYDLDMARAECDRAVKLDSALLSPHLHLGVFDKMAADDDLVNSRLSAAMFKHALDEYNTALRIDPRATSGHSGLGDVLGDPAFAGRDFDCSIGEYEKALWLKPDSTIAMLGIANSYSAEGQWDKAAKYYAAALKKDPTTTGEIANFVPFINRLKTTPDGTPEQLAVLKAAGAALAIDLPQLANNKNPTLENKMATEAQILAMPGRVSPGDPAQCL